MIDVRWITTITNRYLQCKVARPSPHCSFASYADRRQLTEIYFKNDDSKRGKAAQGTS
ncbi:hypothetical protein PILCRDRAFT_813353 [Piloderma croceum F 1598]|uniref:Uncharacterized protein n=1 Tax=Piloderma croceum (strain F 1598) TaxID=765440 RepID=A0A0C3BSB7_PILCF|nr:hypothetical protein PILCRDRAFT_813353 [Piloderma croceum F 1598]